MFNKLLNEESLIENKEELAYYFAFPPGHVDLGEDLVDLFLVDGILLQLCLCQSKSVELFWAQTQWKTKTWKSGRLT